MKNMVKRIVTLDVLRGFALMGIIFINIRQMVFGTMEFNSLDLQIIRFLDVVVDHRFFVIFSFLFGVGFQLFLSRAEAKGESKPRLLFLRRLCILFLIGLVHHYFQPGETLLIYAVIGLILLPFYKLKSSFVLVAGIVVTLAGLYLGPIVVTFGMFLLGHWSGLIGLFENPLRYKRGLRITQAVSLLLIIPMYFAQQNIMNSTGALDVALAVGGLPVSIFYVTTLTLLMRHGVVQKLLAPLASLGRMALTNYLMQTVIILTLSNLLDWPGTVHVSTQMIAAAAILLLQIIFSTLILKRFQMGPAEYLWRLGTYGKKRMVKQQ